jgi:NADH-quinone oxidoreductase subunit F
MDLELLAQVQSNILGNCLCVLGDSMAMPIGSMLEKFRAEFEGHAEEARARNDAAVIEQPASELAAAPMPGPA